MTSHVPDPLTPEERELAARLARIGPHGEPSPALDARILGAAQAAAARKPGRARPPRWPAWAGIAATLALALGAVWQLRPVQEVPVELEETASPVAIRQPSEAAAASDTPGTVDLVSGNAESEPQQPAKAIAASPPPAPEARAAKIAPPEPRAQRSRVPQPAVVFGDPSPVDVPAPPAAPAPSAAAAPPPPPPAPPAPASIKPVPPVAAATRSRDLQPPAARASALAESAASDAQFADNATATRTSVTVTVTDLPVASDSQLLPVDWIERIRQRRDAGDIASARASLALLQHDHPGLLLPDDVRAIAAPAPSDR